MERPTIGPYRIEERLGAGGMGEVFLAYDERLDRRVAVKRIRREALASDEARRRFRREARAAARLSHPAIVQIHDILEDEEGDSLVMERVHGQSLTRLLTEGPLGVGVVVDLARQIAEGLAAAHAEGIVHRDLKTDNVMVTHEGRVKILDFGLAKQLTRAETDLSVAGKIVGTVHAMSPEQAQGFEVDPRSDLFSLGSLLYRALTGRSPFRSASPVQTLTRIATFRQPPVREIEPRVPEALSDLVDHLLEKDPLYRPESAAAVAASLAEIAAEVETGARAAADERAKFLIESETATIARSPTLVGSPQGTADIRPTDPRRQRRAAGWAVALPLLCLGLVAIVWTLFDKRPEQLDAAVLPPQIDEASTHPEPALVGSAVRLALIRGLHSLEGLATAAPDEVDQVTGPASEVARALGVDEAITTRLSCQPRACWVEVHRVAAVDGRTRWSNRFQVFPGDLLELDAVVGGRLQNSYRDRRPLVGAVLEVAPEDYETFLRLRRAWQTRSGPPSAELLAAVAQLHSTSPRFVEAYLLEARIAQGLFVASGQAADLDRALTAVRRAREVAPGDPRALFDLFNIALDGGRLQGADEALAALRRAEPGHGRLLAQQALLREARGQKGEALAEMRAAAERHPSWRNLMDLARMEIRLGELEAAGERLRQLLERDPDNDLALFLLARHELTYGDL
ncbi:MAG: protein kinase, partial [Acidobacteriota bacterium]